MSTAGSPRSASTAACDPSSVQSATRRAAAGKTTLNRGAASASISSSNPTRSSSLRSHGPSNTTPTAHGSQLICACAGPAAPTSSTPASSTVTRRRSSPAIELPHVNSTSVQILGRWRTIGHVGRRVEPGAARGDNQTGLASPNRGDTGEPSATMRRKRPSISPAAQPASSARATKHAASVACTIHLLAEQTLEDAPDLVELAGSGAREPAPRS